VATTLRYALERGIEAAFQLEDSELASEALPDDQHRGRMLFTESAEGGAGVLRRLQAEPDALALAARTALGIAHFDPDTGEDVSHDEPGSERCEKACYDCLLSYGNQFEHAAIDRHLVRDLLLRFAAATTSASASDVPRAEHAEELLRASDTDLERSFLRLLIEGDFRLPDAAQQLLPDAGCRPDFLYREQGVAVFVDGPVHDREDKAAEDAAVEARLLETGYAFVRFNHDADWRETIRAHEAIFGRGRTR
jgi:very-short-patch-repair endonuclease